MGRFAIASALALVVVLAGCGGATTGSTGTATPTASATGTTVVTTTEPPAPTASTTATGTGTTTATLTTPTAATGTTTTPTTTTATPDGEPLALTVDVVRDTYLVVTHAGGRVVPARTGEVAAEYRVRGSGGGIVSTFFPREFGPGDEVYVYRTAEGTVGLKIGDPPDDPRPLQALVNVTVVDGEGRRLATTGDVNVGLAPLEADLSTEVVGDGLVRITHEGGDTLEPYGVEYAVAHTRDGRTNSVWSILSTPFGPGDTAWVYYEADGVLSFTVGDRPDPGESLAGVVTVELTGPARETILDVRIRVDGEPAVRPA